MSKSALWTLSVIYLCVVVGGGLCAFDMSVKAAKKAKNEFLTECTDTGRPMFECKLLYNGVKL